MIEVALTGNVASGKSLVAGFWREAGVPVVSADELAREVVAPGGEGLAQVRRTFGDQVVSPDGALDRAAVRAIVFRDAGARLRLEAILHPRIDALRREWMAAREREGVPLVVAEIPLLFEVGMEAAFDVVVLVDAPPSVRLERLIAKGMEPDEARRIMDAQMDPERKRPRADHVLENDGSEEELRERALALLADLHRWTESR